MNFPAYININYKRYTAVDIMQCRMDPTSEWEASGLDFIMQLLDPSLAPVRFKTSGTTGPSREITFSKQQICRSAANTNRFFNITSDSKLLLCLPTAFVAGKMMIARALLSGANLIWRKPMLNPLMDELDVSFAAFTPAQISAIISDPISEDRFRKIPTILVGGGVISKDLESKLTSYPNQIFASYGMTETLTHIAMRRMGTDVYHALYEDIELDVDENHCLKIKLPFILDDYLQTNDVVELQSNTSFRFIGRLDNIINSGGVKIVPEDLERIIVSHGFLREGEFYITSIPDSVFGEVPALVVIKGVDVNKDKLAMINGLLNKHHSVKHIVYMDTFEYTPTHKLIRRKING